MDRKFLEALNSNVLVCDGAMGTMLYGKGVYINQCFDALNLSRVDLIREIHCEYIAAGAQIIETNTFGAHRLKLIPYGLGKKVREINYAGAIIAREAIKEAGREDTDGSDVARVWVAGSVGPLGKPLRPIGKLSTEDARDIFREQIKGLIDGGVDLLMMETMHSLGEMCEAINAARELCDLPVVAQMNFNEECQTLVGESPEEVVRVLSEAGVAVIGANCSVGPQGMLEILERMAQVATVPLSVQPNAGLPQMVDNRFLYMSSPEYMAEYTRRLIKSGAGLIGACCGSTPAHIRAISAAAKMLRPSMTKKETPVIAVPEKTSVPETPMAQKSPLGKKLADGQFVISVELDPPRGIDPSKILAGAKMLKERGIDAVNIADGPRASPRMSPMPLAAIIHREIGMETILHYTCRDRNLLGMQADLLGAHASGLKNMLLVTGDPPKLGDYPNATAVYDVDSIGLTGMVKRLNQGMDLAGYNLGEPASFLIGVAVDPGSKDIEREVERFESKVRAGAEFAMTQPVYQVELFERFVKMVKHLNVPVLVGILPLVSYRNAEFLHNEVPGMQIPDPIRKRMENAGTGIKAREQGIRIAREALAQCKDFAQGVYVMPPFGRLEAAIKVVEVVL